MHSIEASILILAKAEDCYRLWMDFESFPTFMPRVISVQPAPVEDLIPESLQEKGSRNETILNDPQKNYEGVMTSEVVTEIAHHGNQAWHWAVKGPMGHIFEWTAGIVMNIPNKAVSWATTHNQEIPNTGTVNFLPMQKGKLGEDQTLMEVTMSFSAPGGIIGEFLSDIAHYGDTLLAEALNDFKCHVERVVPYVMDESRQCKIRPAVTSEADLRQEIGASGETPPNPVPKQV